MTHTYNISGLTCGGCVAKAKSELLKIGDITEADVQLAAPQATLQMQKHIPVQTLQTALRKAGNYTISEADGGMHVVGTSAEARSWWETYKPVLLIFGYVLAITLLIEWQRGGFNWMSWMTNFMAGFFLVFSFFKLLNLRGFADSYSMYDVIARHWKGWGYVYAFVELALGICYVLRLAPLPVSVITFVVMGVSIIGVLRSVFSKQTIRCACLGDVFNLPMSTVTIIEDGLMIAMSAVTIVSLL